MDQRHRLPSFTSPKRPFPPPPEPPRRPSLNLESVSIAPILLGRSPSELPQPLPLPIPLPPPTRPSSAAEHRRTDGGVRPSFLQRPASVASNRPSLASLTSYAEMGVLDRIPGVRRLVRRMSESHHEAEELLDEVLAESPPSKGDASPAIKRRASWARTISRLATKEKRSTINLSSPTTAAKSPKSMPKRLVHRKSRESLKSPKHKRSARSLRHTIASISGSSSPIPPVPSLPPYLGFPLPPPRPTSGGETESSATTLDELGVPRNAGYADADPGMDLPPFPQALVNALSLNPSGNVRGGDYFVPVLRRDLYPPQPLSTTFAAAIADTSPTVPKNTPSLRTRGSSLDITFNFDKAQRMQALQAAQRKQAHSPPPRSKMQGPKEPSKKPPTPKSSSRKRYSVRKEASPPNSTPTRIPAPVSRLESISPESPFNVSGFDSDNTPTKPKIKLQAKPSTKATDNPFATRRRLKSSDDADEVLADDSAELAEALGERTVVDQTPTQAPRHDKRLSASVAHPSVAAQEEDTLSPASTPEKQPPRRRAASISPQLSFAFSELHGSYLGHDSTEDSPRRVDESIDLFNETFTPADGSFGLGAEAGWYDPRSLSTIAEVSREEFSRSCFDSYLKDGKRKTKMAAPPPGTAVAASASLKRLTTVAEQPPNSVTTATSTTSTATKRHSLGNASKDEYIRVLRFQETHIIELGEKIRQLEDEVVTLKQRDNETDCTAGNDVTPILAAVDQTPVAEHTPEAHDATEGQEGYEGSKDVDTVGMVTGIDQTLCTVEGTALSGHDVGERDEQDGSLAEYSVAQLNNTGIYDLGARTLSELSIIEEVNTIAEQSSGEPNNITLLAPRQELDIAVAEAATLRAELERATKRYDGVCRQWDKDRMESQKEKEEGQRRADELQRQIRDLKLNSAAVCHPTAQSQYTNIQLSSLMAQSQQATISQLQQLTANTNVRSVTPAPHEASLTDMSIEPIDTIDPAAGYDLQSSLFTLDSAAMDELIILRETCAVQASDLDALVRRGVSFASMAADKAQLQAQLSELERDLETAFVEKETALARAESFESRTLSLLAKVEELTTAATLSAERVRALETYASEDSLRVQALEGANAKLRDDNDELRVQVSNLEQQLQIALRPNSKLKCITPKKSPHPHLPPSTSSSSSLASTTKAPGRIPLTKPTPFGTTRMSTLPRSNGAPRLSGGAKASGNSKPAAPSTQRPVPGISAGGSSASAMAGTPAKPSPPARSENKLRSDPTPATPGRRAAHSPPTSARSVRQGIPQPRL